MTMNDIKILIAQIYKSDSARLLAVLTQIFGSHNFDLAEGTLLTWKRYVRQPTFFLALLKFNRVKLHCKRYKKPL